MIVTFVFSMMYKTEEEKKNKHVIESFILYISTN